MAKRVVTNSITCPVCREPTWDAHNISAGYCPFCQEHTRQEALAKGLFCKWDCCESGCSFTFTLPAIDRWVPALRRRVVESLDKHMEGEMLIQHSHSHMPHASLTMNVIRMRVVRPS